VDVQSNWWQEFFHGAAVEMWLKALPPEYSREEAAHVERTLGLPKGAEILDVPCGAGRLATELAESGYEVTGVDLSQGFLEHAKARDAGGRVRWEHRDMRDLPWSARFDGAFCFGNSFGYLDDEGNTRFLRAVASALKPGGRFVLETPMVIESLLPNLKDRPWYKAGDVYLLIANQYDRSRSRLNIEYTFVSNGRIEVRRGTHRAYTYRELLDLVESAGFAVTTVPSFNDAAGMKVTLVGTRR
jgi:SAM-dependent methyltransferase